MDGATISQYQYRLCAHELRSAHRPMINRRSPAPPYHYHSMCCRLSSNHLDYLIFAIALHDPNMGDNHGKPTYNTSENQPTPSREKDRELWTQGRVRSELVCPNDRMLALRAQLRRGWSARTQQPFQHQRPSVQEQEIIKSKIKLIHEMEIQEQMRIGILVHKFDLVKKSAVGDGVTNCILCGEKPKLLDRLANTPANTIPCVDCRKLTCGRCGVSPNNSHRSSLRRCKICSIRRELWIRSGAWFFKDIPVHILPVDPPKKEVKPPPRSRFILERGSWARRKASVSDDRSSSDDEDERYSSISTRLAHPSTSLQSDRQSWENRSVDTLGLNEINTDGSVKSWQWARNSRRGTSESSVSGSSCEGVSRKSSPSRFHTRSPSPYAGQRHQSNGNGLSRGSTATSIISSHQTPGDGEHCSLPPSSTLTSKHNGVMNDCNTAQCVSQDSLLGGVPVIQLTPTFDPQTGRLLISLHRALNLKPLVEDNDPNPFCKVLLLPELGKFEALKSRVVHQTCNPEFNDSLTLFDVTDEEISYCVLHIVVLDDDRYGHDLLGQVKHNLKHLFRKNANLVTLQLESPCSVNHMENVWWQRDWCRGQILISLRYSSARRALIVRVMSCRNLPSMDSNGLSDPFVKLYLKARGTKQKKKTKVKWKDLNPVFKEEFIFETKHSDLMTQSIVVSVWDRDLAKRDDYIGCVEIGCYSRGRRLLQWHNMIGFTNCDHEEWHFLSGQPPP